MLYVFTHSHAPRGNKLSILVEASYSVLLKKSLCIMVGVARLMNLLCFARRNIP